MEHRLDAQFLFGEQHAVHGKRFASGMMSFASEVYGQEALANTLEARSPYEDRRLIEFAVGMPLEAKLFAPCYKFVLRQSMQGIMPESVRWRHDLGGHPGWKFTEQFIERTMIRLPEIWNFSRVKNALSRWVDSRSLQKLWFGTGEKQDRIFDKNRTRLRLVFLTEWLYHRQFV
jgi:asparagine synthase (glutamine-hydrolysing)